MIKHPGPWTLSPSGFVVDAHGITVCGEKGVTDDHETRAILLHAREMWEALKGLASTAHASHDGAVADVACCDLVEKIESEIAKGKP